MYGNCGGPFFNPKFIEDRYKKFQNIFLLNGTIVPVYLLMIFFYAHVFEHVGSGPFWKIKIGKEAERCRKNWWINFFFLNNYLYTDSLCMFQSWYVACDMHLTLIAPFVVKIVINSKKKGFIYLILFITISFLLNFTIIFYNKYDGVLRLYLSTLEDLTSSFTFNEVYIKTHHRATPYLSGMMAAFVYLKIKKINYKFSLKEIWMYSVIALICALSAICGAWLFYIPGRKYDAFENALYASSHRLLWAFAMSWIAIGGGTKAFGLNP
ncbi:conserved hypothetical protein [Pediculus humanus corporis]|uniref:Acyltransferase 3 domain-containing protein n=1 Tax=Pediculus humanus subsp. corporis TaxID=121224 RepID=E0VKG3_PEDHC|nr:uncharacterized protein Phum_PHUM260880 [Pediculus humanus corporis]EEB13843.1 conserved hypothetical protein [Pediculus humanus corporis]